MKRFVLTLLLLVCIQSRCQSQFDSAYDATKNVNPDSRKEKHNILLKSAVGIGYASATFLCYRYLDAQIQDESQEGKTTFKSHVLNTIEPFGLGRYNTIGFASVTAYSYLTKNIKLQKTALLWGGSLLINSIVTDGLKKTFQRHRPNTGDPYNTFDWVNGPKINKSFPSANTSNAFTTATVFATMYKDKKWVPPLTYSLATLVGVARIYNNGHWASDVMAGAAVGFLSAKGVIGLYKIASKKYILVIPQIGQKFSSFSLIYRF
jgi:membrane-associated phospholipid phosphatase